MADFKYVIIRAGDFEFPIIFPDKLVHEDVAAATLRLEPIRKIGDPAVVVSAGFLNLDGNVFIDMERESESLGVGPRIGDEMVIRTYSYAHGINTEPIDMDRMKSSPQRGVPVIGKESRVKERFTNQTRPVSGLDRLRARSGKGKL